MTRDEPWIVAMPCEDAAGASTPLAAHFGRAPCYAVLHGAGARTLALRFVDNTRDETSSCLQPVQRLLGEGVRTIIVRGIGARSLARLQHVGVEVLAAGAATTVEEALQAWHGQLLEHLGPSGICDGPGGRPHGRGAARASDSSDEA
jgi:predicted Fe-Mo cluster-binding NifX family protein